jgi:hypothetical protein
MKRVIFLFCIFFPIISNSQQVVTKLNTSIFDLSYLNIGVETNGQGLGGALTTAVSSTLMYSLNGIDNIISIPNYGYKDLFPIHFIKKNNTWKIDSLYKDISIVGRNYSMIDTIGTFAYADHGREYGPRNTWPYGHIWQVANLNGKLVWTQVSKIKSFYHSVATSDLNSDGQIDFIGLHMGTYNSKNGVSNLHTYKKNKDSTFSEWYDVLSDINFPEKKRYSAGAVFAKDLYGDKNPEIIRGSYGQGGDLERHSLIFYQIDPVDKVYKYAKEALDLGVFKIDPTIGSTSIKSIDFNKDGFLDLAVAFEGYLNGVQLWKNDGKGNFSSDQYFGFTGGAWGDTTGYSFREFEVADIDHDGWEDIILHPTGFDNNFRINPEPAPSQKTKGDGIRLNKSIWKNNKGAFKFLETDIAFKGIYPGSMKGFLINNELRYFGFENAEFTGPNKTLHNFKLHDITIHFCNNLIKPTFNTTKYSFCNGDSIKLTITNINKGDSLKWYYGTKIDLTNVSNKTFTDSTKLFVTRTDSLGCVISSDTVQIKKYSIPSAPSLSRDTANFLLSGAPGTTWYKDGSAIIDTAQKYKPTTAGSYTAKTTTNGCTSVMSAAYYYLVTDIINLSNDEFIKLAPNPFINQLNFDFTVKGYQKLNIEVYDVATGSKVANQQNITAGTQIQLGQLARGTYIIRVTSNDNKIAQQFKMVKL